MITLYIELKGLEKRFAVYEDGKPLYYRTLATGDTGQQGAYYLGRIDSVHSGLNAAFVEIGDEKKGYLTKQKTVRFSEHEHPNKKDMTPTTFLPQGQRLLVQIEKEAHGQKGAVLTNLVEVTGVSLVYAPYGKYCAVSKKIPEPIREDLRKNVMQWLQGPEGVVVRTDAAKRSLNELQQELESLREQYHSLVQKAEKEKKPGLLQSVPLFWQDLQYWIARSSGGECVCDDANFLHQLPLSDRWNKTWHHEKSCLFTKYGIDDTERKVHQKHIWLPNGGAISIEYTEAMTVVDVNTARQVKNRNAEHAFEETNLLAAKEVAKQLLVRDISGMVIVDFINMKSQSSRQRVFQTLHDQVGKDQKHVTVYPFNELGCVMLTRKRTKPMWVETHTERDGTGYQKSKEAVAYDLDRAIRDTVAQHEVDRVHVVVDKGTWAVFSREDSSYVRKLEEELSCKIVEQVQEAAKPFFTVSTETQS